MSISNLDFVYTDTLLPYEERLKGKFVYLNKDYGEYKKGVYFYGENELERLTNDFVTPINPTGHVQLPEFNNTIYTYNGEKQTILPSNWEDIEKYVYIFGNTRTDAGKYTMTVMLKYMDWTWEDGKNEPKEFEFTINPLHLTSNDVIIKLNQDTWEIGESTPKLENIYFDDIVLEHNKDFYTETNSDKRIITVTFINNYEGVVTKKYKIVKKTVSDPFIRPNEFEYTGEDIVVLPNNWNDIKEYCTISGNIQNEIGKYFLLVSLKNPDMYCWEKTGDSKMYILEYDIKHVHVPVPVWDEEDKYDVFYNNEYHTFLPLNWDKIRDFVNISEHEFKYVGDYDINISLKKTGYIWSDGTTGDKTFTCRINKFLVDLPIWRDATVGVYTGNEIYYRPINWDRISQYCTISGYYAVNVGDYETNVSLIDSHNYGWRLFTGAIVSDDQIKNWKIIPADGYFKHGPYLNGSFYVGETITCTALYVDDTCELKYRWYRNSSPTIVGAEYIDETKTNEYLLTSKDIEKYIVCEVIAKSHEGISNYNGNKATTVSIMRVQKMIIYNGIKFKDDKNEESTHTYSSIFQIPEVEGVVMGDDSHLEYTVIQGSDIGDFTEKNSNVLLLNNKVGDIIVEVKVVGSTRYVYLPDTLRFTLHVYSNDVVLWGLYDKNNEPNEQQMLLENGIIPETSQVATLKENHEGIHSLLFRKNFPFRKYNGDEQVYYGWYVLLPESKTMKALHENCYSSMDVDELLVKDENGNPKVFESNDKRNYNLYCKFNVGKMSDNWMLHILFR